MSTSTLNSFISGSSQSRFSRAFSVTTQSLSDSLYTWICRLLDIPATLIKTIVDKIVDLVLACVSRMCTLGIESMSSIFDILRDLTYSLYDSYSSVLKNIFIFFNLFISFSDLVKEIFNPFIFFSGGNMRTSFGFNFYTRLAIFCNNLYNFLSSKFSDISNVVPQSGEYTHFLLSGIFMSILPQCVRNLIRDINTVTTHKLFDDTFLIFDIFSLLINIPRYILQFFLPKDFGDYFGGLCDQLELLIPISRYGKLIASVGSLVGRFEKDKRVVHDTNFSAEFDKLKPDFDDYIIKMQATRKDLPTYVYNIWIKFKKLGAKIAYMRNNQRVEPVWLVFSGPPGTGKTSLMNTLVAEYQKKQSVYVHSSHDDGKDFYDQYDNEDILVLDDVGQKGVYQWSPFINMISTTKYPLNCAEADKKGTKFFTSRLVMCTTNNSNPTLVADCGISDITALQRRMTRVKFDKCKFESGKYIGEIEVEEWDLSLPRAIGGQWKSLRVINCNNILGTVVLNEIDLIVRLKMCQRLNQFKDSEEGVSKLDLQVLPQAGGLCDNLFTYFREQGELICFDFCLFIDFIFSSIVQAGQFLKFLFLTKAGVASTVRESSWRCAFLPPLDIFSYKILLLLVSSVYLIGSFLFSYFSDLLKKEVNPKVVHYSSTRNKVSFMQVQPQAFEKIFQLASVDEVPSQLRKLAGNMYAGYVDYVNVNGVQSKSEFLILFNGSFIYMPAHAVINKPGTDLYLTVYSASKNIVYDKVLITVVRVFWEDDLVVCRLPRNIPIISRKIHMPLVTSSKSYYLVLPNGVVNLKDKLRQTDFNIRYIKLNKEFNFFKDELQATSVAMESLCGAVLVNIDGYIFGHHVAASADNSVGFVKLWSKSTLDAIRSLYNEIDVVHEVEIVRSDVDVNGMFIKDNLVSVPSTKSEIVPSIIYGVFDVERKPAEFSDKPLTFIKELSKSALQPTEMPIIEHLNGVEEFIMDVLSDWKPVVWNESQIVNGDGVTTRIDPTTSVGFGLSGDKRDYLDYEHSVIMPHTKQLMLEFCNDIINGQYPNFHFVEQFKDELRDTEKVAKPRIFQPSPLIHTILGRKYFGSLLSFFSKPKVRFGTGVMVGINPFGSQWEQLLKFVTTYGDNCFDGDFGKFDKRMLPVFQQLINKVLLKKFCLPDEEMQVIDFILKSLIYTPVVCVSNNFMTNHSLPSGSFLTAYYNSLIHLAYIFYSFSYLYKEQFHELPTLVDYKLNVKCAVYGDDNLTGVSNKIKSWFNGPAVARVLVTLGLEFTQGDKSEWDYLVRSVHKCTFLKRGFKFHPSLQEIVAPLQLKSMKSTLNWVKDDLINEEMTIVKSLNFQREAYLHADLYEHLLQHVDNWAEDKGLIIPWLTSSYLLKLYKSDKFVDYLDLT